MTVRLHRDFVRSTLSSDLPASGAGSTTLHSAGLTGVGAVSGGAVLAVSIDPDATLGPPEIVHVTSLTAGANSGVITRGQEGTSATHYPAGTPWVHALTAWDIDAVSGTGGGSGGITFGPAPDPVVTGSGDLTDPSSWWGSAAVRFVTWTPTSSGLVSVQPPAADGDGKERDYVVFHGTVANTEYPDRTAASSSFSGSQLVDAWRAGGSTSGPRTFVCIAGDTYTIGVVYWDASPYTARSISLVELDRSLQPFGGISPLVPVADLTPVSVTPSGTLVLTPPPYDPAAGNTFTAGEDGTWAIGSGTTATGSSAFAEGTNTTASAGASHAEGGGTTASGSYAHAEGNTAHASGVASHAEAWITTASGDYSHAEGLVTTASGEASHAEGGNTTAGGFASHAGGYYAHADRTCEQSVGAGTGSISGRRIAAGRLVFKVETADGTATKLLDPLGSVEHALSTNAAATFRGLVTAYRDSGSTHLSADAVVAGWEVEGVLYGGTSPDAVLVGSSVTLLHRSAGASAWTVAVTLDAGHLTFTVTGDVGHTVTWGAFIDLIEVGS